MRRWIVTNIFFAVFVVVLSSCAHHQTSSVAQKLDPSDLYPLYKTKVIDLKSQSKCPSPPSVRLLNAETRNGDFLIAEIGGHTHYIRPKELTNHIIDYMNDAFERCQVKATAASTKVIEASIEKAEMKLSGPFSARGAAIQLRINIPEKKYTNIYSAEEWSAQAIWTTMAYAIHLATWKMMADPAIQDYVLCR